MKIGAVIRELRKERKIGQDKLAEMSAISQARLSQIENGEKPSDETLAKICQVLNVSVALVYIMSFEKVDYSPKNGELYDQFHPIIEGLVKQIASIQD